MCAKLVRNSYTHEDRILAYTIRPHPCVHSDHIHAHPCRVQSYIPHPCFPCRAHTGGRKRELCVSCAWHIVLLRYWRGREQFAVCMDMQTSRCECMSFLQKIALVPSVCMHTALGHNDNSSIYWWKTCTLNDDAHAWKCVF